MAYSVQLSAFSRGLTADGRSLQAPSAKPNERWAQRSTQ